MKNYIKSLAPALIMMLLFIGCEKKEYTMGDLSAPTNLVINTEIIGADATNPNGDGSGEVRITLSANDALSYKIDYDTSNGIQLEHLPTGTIVKRYGTVGVNTYLITAVAYGRGGTSTTITKSVTVRSDYTPDATIVENLTGGTSKTWVVDKSIPAHFGVGPWNVGSIRPEWWAAAINEKVACCNCFYTATFTFTKLAGANNYSLQVASPDGAFTKTGSLTTLPGIPGSGGEGCYSYGGGTSSFSFMRASSGAPVIPTNPGNSTTTETSIMLSGNNTFIGYGALQKEYEILSITPTAMYLRVQGTETGNAWYLKLKAI